jgi:hypothetical protein
MTVAVALPAEVAGSAQIASCKRRPGRRWPEARSVDEPYRCHCTVRDDDAAHLGFHAPLLMTNNANLLPSQLDAYFSSVAPTYTNTPTDGPYNMTYVIGSWNQVTWGPGAR